MLRSVFFAGGRGFGGRVTLNDIWRCGRRVRPSVERRDEARKEGTKANRNSWCLNERGQLRLDIQSAEERRVGVDHRHSTAQTGWSRSVPRSSGDAELLLLSTRFRATMTTTKKDECNVSLASEGQLAGANACMGLQITAIRTGSVPSRL